MQVTFTNVSINPIFVACIYRELLPGVSVTARRTAAQLDAEQQLKIYVSEGVLELSFTMEDGDGIPVGTGISPVSWSDLTRPAATTVAPYTAIWNTDDNATNWSDGENWRDNDGNLT